MAKGSAKSNQKLSAPAEEAYKVLRTNIQFCEFDRKIKTLTITSFYPGEGKSTTCINLGASIAGAGSRVLVVDADLRKPMLMKQLGPGSFKGLSNLLSGHATVDEVINGTKVEGLYYIACGVKPPNPAELIGSDRFKRFLEEVRERFDMVIVDTPPLGSVIDGAIVAAQTDGTVIVIQPKVVEYENAQLLMEQLLRANARILGVVLNKVDKSDHRHYHGYYDFYRDGAKPYGKQWLKKIKQEGRKL